MELGQRLRQARQDAGLSQRQLCGDVITRNMLSQIENGTARPSMETLRYLAGRLGKPLSWFLEEVQASDNQMLMARLRTKLADPEAVLEELKTYRSPDPVFDPERYLLEAMCCLALAGQAAKEKRIPYAKGLLERAALAGERTLYYTPVLEQERLLVLYELEPENARALAEKTDPRLWFLLAESRADAGDMGAVLDAAPADTPRWHRLRAQAWLQGENYGRALDHFAKTEPDRSCLEAMELCCRELGDFEGAYRCACSLRELKE